MKMLNYNGTDTEDNTIHFIGVGGGGGVPVCVCVRKSVR